MTRSDGLKASRVVLSVRVCCWRAKKVLPLSGVSALSDVLKARQEGRLSCVLASRFSLQAIGERV